MSVAGTFCFGRNVALCHAECGALRHTRRISCMACKNDFLFAFSILVSNARAVVSWAFADAVIRKEGSLASVWQRIADIIVDASSSRRSVNASRKNSPFFLMCSSRVVIGRAAVELMTRKDGSLMFILKENLENTGWYHAGVALIAARTVLEVPTFVI